MKVDFKNTVVYRWWKIIYKDVVRVDRIMYYVLCLFMIIIPVLLYYYGSFWMNSSRDCHSRYPEECLIAWARFIPFLILCVSQVGVLITFACNIEGMLRNFLNPEYDALADFKNKFK